MYKKHRTVMIFRKIYTSLQSPPYIYNLTFSTKEIKAKYYIWLITKPK